MSVRGDESGCENISRVVEAVAIDPDREELSVAIQNWTPQTE